MTDNQQDAGEEEWEKRYDLHVGYYIVNSLGQAVCDGPEDYIDQIIADHAAARRARKLEERVRELEALANDAVLMVKALRGGGIAERWLARHDALLSATGKEEAG